MGLRAVACVFEGLANRLLCAGDVIIVYRASTDALIYRLLKTLMAASHYKCKKYAVYLVTLRKFD